MAAKERQYSQLNGAVDSAQKELKSVKGSTEKTIEIGRQDVKEIKDHVAALTQEVNDLSKQRDALHSHIQKEHLQHEKESQVRHSCSDSNAIRSGYSVGRQR